MRRGRGGVKRKIGGACDCAVMKRKEESAPSDSLDCANTVNTMLAKETADAELGGPKGACIAGLVLQQSCP